MCVVSPEEPPLLCAQNDFSASFLFENVAFLFAFVNFPKCMTLLIFCHLWIVRTPISCRRSLKYWLNDFHKILGLRFLPLEILTRLIP